MAAAHYKLDNLIAYLDYNQLQIDGPIRSVLNPEPFPDSGRLLAGRYSLWTDIP